ncbi:MAG: hypothetical protein U0457_07710 [Candidatus Sericytochromatia bacterium]
MPSFFDFTNKKNYITYITLILLYNSCTANITSNKIENINPINTNKIQKVENISFSNDKEINFKNLDRHVYKLSQEIITSNSYSNYTESSIEAIKVIKNQEEFNEFVKIDQNLRNSPSYTPEGLIIDNIDFSKNYLLVISKITGAYDYKAKITSLKIKSDELIADFNYKIIYSKDNNLNDFIRPINFFILIDKIDYKNLKINTILDNNKD